MPSTFSPSLRLELIANGEQIGTWGDTTNRNLGTLLEQAIAGSVFITIPDADYTLTASQGVSDQARNASLNIGGVLTATRNIIAPSVEKTYIIRNSTAGGQNIVIKTATGTGVTIPAGLATLVFCDGTNFFAGVTYLGGPINAASLTLTTPLPVSSGGTGASNAGSARANLGMGSAAAFDASSANAANTVVQRDGSGNFAAGTIFANLTGTATTANNATNLNGLPSSSYAKTNTSFDWVQVFGGSSTSIDLLNTYGTGTYWVQRSNGGTQTYGVIVYGNILSDNFTTNLNFVSAGSVVTANVVTTNAGSFVAVYKLRKL